MKRLELERRNLENKWRAEKGNSGIGHYKLIETITLPITIGNWHYSRIRVIGNVSDLASFCLFFLSIHNEFISEKLLIIVVS